MKIIGALDQDLKNHSAVVVIGDDRLAACVCAARIACDEIDRLQRYCRTGLLTPSEVYDIYSTGGGTLARDGYFSSAAPTRIWSQMFTFVRLACETVGAVHAAALVVVRTKRSDGPGGVFRVPYCGWNYTCATSADFCDFIVSKMCLDRSFEPTADFILKVGYLDDEVEAVPHRFWDKYLNRK
jgi:hypothetical protein